MAKGLLGSRREPTSVNRRSRGQRDPGSQGTLRVRGPHFRSPLLLSGSTAARRSCRWGRLMGTEAARPQEEGGKLVSPLHVCCRPESWSHAATRSSRTHQTAWGWDRLHGPHRSEVIKGRGPSICETNASHPGPDLPLLTTVQRWCLPRASLCHSNLPRPTSDRSRGCSSQRHPGRHPLWAAAPRRTSPGPTPDPLTSCPSSPTTVGGGAQAKPPWTHAPPRTAGS